MATFTDAFEIPYRFIQQVSGGSIEHTPDNATKWHALSEHRKEKDGYGRIKGHHFHSFRAAAHWLSLIEVQANGGKLYEPESGDPA